MGSKIGAVIDPKGEILARLKHDIENRRLDRYNISGSVISSIQNSFKSQGKRMIFLPKERITSFFEKNNFIRLLGNGNGKQLMQQKIADNSMIQELKNEFDQTQVSSDEGTPLGNTNFKFIWELVF